MDGKSVTRTKNAFKTTFFNLLENKPYSKITLTELIKESGYSRSTFYTHYLDKEDFIQKTFVEGIDNFAADIQNSVEKNSPANDSESAFAMLNCIYMHVEKNKPFFDAIIEETIPGYAAFTAADVLSKSLKQTIVIADKKWEEKIDKSYFFFMIANELMTTIRYWFSNNHINTAKDMSKLSMASYQNAGFYSLGVKV